MGVKKQAVRCTSLLSQNRGFIQLWIRRACNEESEYKVLFDTYDIFPVSRKSLPPIVSVRIQWVRCKRRQEEFSLRQHRIIRQKEPSYQHIAFGRTVCT